MKPAKLDPHEAWVLANAEHFTTCIFRGRGCFDVVKHSSLPAAIAAGRDRANESGKVVMVYAVFGVHQGHLQNIEPERNNQCTTP